MRIPRRAVAITMAALVPLGVVATAQPAVAVSGYRVTTQYIGGGSTVNVRSAASTTSSVVQTLPVQTAIEIDCQLVGGRLGFSQYAENRTWDRLTNGRYVHDAVTTTPGGARIALSDGGYVAWSSTVPRCAAPTASSSAPAQPAAQTFRATTQYIGGGATVNIRRSADVGSPVARTEVDGSTIAIVCQLVGSRLGFSQYADNRTWDRLADNTYVHDVVTTTPGGPRSAIDGGGYVAWSAALPRCTSGSAPSSTQAVLSSPAARAVRWAADRKGEVTASADVQRLFSDWAADGALAGEWSGDCPKFVQAAWKQVGVSPKTGKASVIYAKYGSPTNGRSAAPVGALVFWPTAARGVGHVAISDGQGGVWSTVGQDGDRAPIAYRLIADIAHHGAPGWPSGWPAGWSMP
ncbi:hypothetical protein [Amnibacterium endophyticum]|uniref:SH3b domain-containing protein n=1 Tax=Amnibacterium endophyticum TaxID=2109337 RepID=A0ABW4LDY9_9MICO